MDIISLLKEGNSYNNFNKLIEFGKFSHAYLIVSPDEDYNKAFCTLLALRLNCASVCRHCESCVKILSGTHPDVLTFPKTKNFVVDDAKGVIEELNVLPMLSNYKIFIINNFNKATVQAQNKLLKSLEEPPENVIFLINATTLETVLPTVQSRTQKIELEPIDLQKLREFIIEADGKVNENAILEGAGYPGITLKYNENQTFLDNSNFIEKILENMKSSKDVITYSSTFSIKEGFEERLNLLEHAFDKLLAKIAAGEPCEYTKEGIAMIFEKINEAKKQFIANCNLNLIADVLLLGILEVKYICK